MTTTSIFIKTVSDLKLIREYCQSHHMDLYKEGKMIKKASVKANNTRHHRPKTIQKPSLNQLRAELRYKARVNIVLNDLIDVDACKKFMMIKKGAIKEMPPVHCRFKVAVRDLPHFNKLVSRMVTLAGEGSHNWTIVGKAKSKILKNKAKGLSTNLEFVVYNENFPKEEATFMSLI